ncbi:aldolase catalytic domain-containing protein [Selenomonas artemidis]|nr:aldolase catalytic domain-containing protein [Selenomonas artemidis]
MGRRELLDCTLRDGGYVNDWAFGHDRIIEIFERLVSSGVEYIEIGFLDARRPFDMNRSIMPDTAAANRIFAGVDKGDAVVLGMIDYGTCGIEHLQPAGETFIDGIRVIFKEHLMYEALDFCAEVQALGYKVFAQMVSVTTYTDEKLREYAAAVNKIKPYATSMVDTYGLLDEEQLMHIFSILDAHVDPGIKIGFHAHNNFQLGFANAKTLLASDSSRNLLADGTIYGMGKSAGNAPLELLMMYMNTHCGGRYDTAQVLETIDTVIYDIYQKQSWGYNMFFYIASSTHCHPNYVSYLMNKKTLSVKQIIEILGTLPQDKQLMYDAKFIEERYLAYQSIACDDAADVRRLRKLFKGRSVLLLGPGNTIHRQKSRVTKYIAEENPIVVSVNYAPKHIPVDYVFLTKAKRYTQLRSDMSSGMSGTAEIIATSNVTKAQSDFSYILRYDALIDPTTEIIDNSLVMLLKAMIRIGLPAVALAGFDGYSRRSDNYFDISREYSFAKEKASYLNDYVKNVLRDLRGKLEVTFVTASRYEK